MIGCPAARRIADRVDGPRECPLEPVEPVGEPARPGVEVDRVDRQVVAARRGDRVVEPLEVDPELGRPVAGVLEVLVVAGARARVDPHSDRDFPAPAGRTARSG